MKIKVRAAVVYTADGICSIHGWTEWEGADRVYGDDGDMVSAACESLEEPLGHHFIEAEIEIPDPVPVATVEGRVVRG